MAEEFFKGLGRYIPPELRNLGAPLKWLAESQRTPQIVNNPNVKKLMTSTSNLSRGSNLLKAITDYTIAGLDATGGGRVLTAPSKIAAKGGKLLDDKISKLSGKFLELKTPLNKALKEIGEKKISTMTNKELVEYINKNYPDVNTTLASIQGKQLKTIKRSPDAQIELKAALDNIKNPENYSMVELMNKPSIKKVMEKFNMSKDTFKKYKSNFGITQKKLSKQENFLDKAGVNPVEFKFFINKYNPTTLQLKSNFPKLKNVAKSTIDTWRQKNNLSKIPDPVKEKILSDVNPRLQSQLDFVPKGSTTPIKHKDAFSEIITINNKGKPLDVTKTKIVKAHGIGEGGISKQSEEIIKSKIAMIPDEFLKDEKIPKFFLTSTGNNLHRDIEDNLILALVKKYKLLGHEFVDGSWKQVRKSKILNPKKRIEIKKLENEIFGYQNELNDLDAYTLFYNPVKDKMVTHGKPLSEIPGLGNLLNQVQNGTKKLRYGGLVGISHLTRPL